MGNSNFVVVKATEGTTVVKATEETTDPTNGKEALKRLLRQRKT